MLDHIGFRQLVHAHQVPERSLGTATPALDALRAAPSPHAAPPQAARLAPPVLRVTRFSGACVGTSQIVQVLHGDHGLFSRLLMLILFFHYELNSCLFAIDLLSLSG